MIKKTKNLYKGLGWPTIFTHIRFFTAPYIILESLVSVSGTIIDLGCGFGIFSNYLGLVQPSRKIVGLELDHNKMRYADRGLSNVSFLNEDVTNWNIPKADVILLIHVLHHLNSFEEQELLLKQCKEVLNHDGSLIIAEVDKKPIMKYFLSWLADRLLYPGQAIFYRNPNEFLDLFNKLGFKVKCLPAHENKPFSHIIYILKKNVFE